MTYGWIFGRPVSSLEEAQRLSEDSRYIALRAVYPSMEGDCVVGKSSPRAPEAPKYMEQIPFSRVAPTGMYLRSNGVAAEWAKPKPASILCEYCTTPHTSTECPNCGAPADKEK